MVGKRTWAGMGNGGAKNNGNIKPAVARFQDASNKAVEDNRREQIKNRLIDGVEREALEHYRKSKDEVSSLYTFTQLVCLLERSFADTRRYRSNPTRARKYANSTKTRMNP
jgi:hypothetical protein